MGKCQHIHTMSLNNFNQYTPATPGKTISCLVLEEAFSKYTTEKFINNKRENKDFILLFGFLILIKFNYINEKRFKSKWISNIWNYGTS